MTLQLPPGEILSEVALKQLLGIGRTPIREALQGLSMEGLVVILPRRGILVSDINVRNQLELLSVRREIERLMASLAARRASVDVRARLQLIAEAMDISADNNADVEFMRLDLEFNQLISQASGNEYARKCIRLMQGLARRFWYQHYKDALDLPRAARLHAAVAREVASGDAEAAGKASDELIDYIEEFTRDTLEVGHHRRK